MLWGAGCAGCGPSGAQAAGAGRARRGTALDSAQAVSESRASRPVASLLRQTPLPHDPGPWLGFSGGPGRPGEGSGHSVALGSGHPLWVLPRGPPANGLSVSLLPAAYSTPGTSPANRSFVGLGPRDPAGIYQAQVGAERPAGAGEGGPGTGARPGAQGEAGLLGPPPPYPQPAPHTLLGPKAACSFPRGTLGAVATLGPFVQLGRLRLAEARDLPRITQEPPELVSPWSPRLPCRQQRDRGQGGWALAEGAPGGQGRGETEAACGRGWGLVAGHVPPPPRAPACQVGRGRPRTRPGDSEQGSESSEAAEP